MAINYAGTLEKCFIINTSWILKTSWKLIESKKNSQNLLNSIFQRIH